MGQINPSRQPLKYHLSGLLFHHTMMITSYCHNEYLVANKNIMNATNSGKPKLTKLSFNNWIFEPAALFLDRCCQSEGGQMQNSNRMTKQHLGQHCYLSSTDFQFVLDFLSIVFLFSVPAFFMTRDCMESKGIDLKPTRLWRIYKFPLFAMGKGKTEY